MGRLTTNTDEARHVLKITQGMPLFGIVLIRMKDGTVLDGVIRRSDIRHGAASETDQAPAGYSASFTVETRARELVTIDVLDVHAVANAWSEFKGEYARLGMVSIADLPPPSANGWSTARWK
ncbi:hypothetical protein [Cupriavidus malaysiensis]|uniref:CBS domain-containing protein n=1 Tax=Cupriavidus malaysiensis TaxID=367825 RepID=A0ABM6F1W0_9BURK|nr:hypothetical protein [Cupriavidus malaysiensis]AOZ05335.1 hypothetical protein BKK80_05560 [Cupriavidus malaysiensis]